MEFRLPGHSEAPCERCGEKVILAPSSLSIIERFNPEIICGSCIPNGDYTVVATGDQIQDVERIMDRQRRN